MCGGAVNRPVPGSWQSGTDLWSDPTMPGAGCHGGTNANQRKKGSYLNKKIYNANPNLIFSVQKEGVNGKGHSCNLRKPMGATTHVPVWLSFVKINPPAKTPPLKTALDH